VGLL
jgi:hypothetical protein